MWRLFPVFQWFWGAVVSTIIVGAVTNRLYGPMLGEVWDFLRSYGALISLILLGAGALTFWSWRAKRRRAQRQEIRRQWQEKERQHREQAERDRLLRQQFRFFKPATELSPEDLGFRVLKGPDRPGAPGGARRL